jgi:hypothetical protein
VDSLTEDGAEHGNYLYKENKWHTMCMNYRKSSIDGMEYQHRRVNHESKVYVVGDVHTQTIEGFWSLVKRGIGGVYHSVSQKYLQTYLDEYSFRLQPSRFWEPHFPRDAGVGLRKGVIEAFRTNCLKIRRLHACESSCAGFALDFIESTI